MSSIKVDNYNNLTDSANTMVNTVNELNDSTNTSSKDINNLMDANTFSGPIANYCADVWQNIGTMNNNSTTVLKNNASNLVNVQNNYEETDKNSIKDINNIID